MSTKAVAIITAASKGMGAAIARTLAERNYDVAVVARSDGLIDLAKQIGGFAIQGDVSSEADLSRAVEAVVKRFGRIDAVVNNTGHPPTGELLGLSDDDWHFGLDFVLMNVVRMARLVTPIMLSQGGGNILNISSINALQPDARFPISSVLRSGLANFTKLYADRYAKDGIRMNNLLPGRIDSYPQPPERIAEVPSGRLGKVTEIASVAAFLLSTDASYINGQSLPVDGGLLRAGR